MEAWVIKRDDGDYLANPDYDMWTHLYKALMLISEKEARKIMKIYGIKKAKPVKIKIIEEVEEDE